MRKIQDILQFGEWIMEKTFGQLVREARKNKDMTALQLSQQLNKGISLTYITRIELYGEIPSPEVICDLAHVLDLSIPQLLNTAWKEKTQTFQDVLAKKYEPYMKM